MDKNTTIAIVLAVFLILSAVLVSADFSNKSKLSTTSSCDGSQNNKGNVCSLDLEKCGADTCNNQCGGNCGIPSCGCQRG